MSWSPDPDRFLADLETLPVTLRSLAARLDASWSAVDPEAVRRVMCLGMGSSRFAALGAASRLRATGLDAVAEYASARAAHPGGPGTLAVAISAGGSTAETNAALARHAENGSTTVAVTNDPSSPLTGAASIVVAMEAGLEEGGIACRTYAHTIALLMALEDRLRAGGGAAATACRAAAEAADDLLARRSAWLTRATELMTATERAFLLAPVERIGSAEQGALMLREGPRLHADACETGDWLHVDVYLTKPLDYRALVFAGSRSDEPVMSWMTERVATVVAVGGEVHGAAMTIRFPGDDDRAIATVIEMLVPALIAAECWRR